VFRSDLFSAGCGTLSLMIRALALYRSVSVIDAESFRTDLRKGQRMATPRGNRDNETLRKVEGHQTHEGC
jgi:hypothetical protein